MKEIKVVFKFFLIALTALYLNNSFGQGGNTSSDYTLIIEGYDWGPAANKVILDMGKELSEVNPSDFKVMVDRSVEGVELGLEESKGERKIVYAFVSDEKGNRIDEGSYVTLILYVAPNDVLGSPIKYVRKDNRGKNQWINYHLSVTQNSTQRVWNTEKNRVIPLLDEFDLAGTFTKDNITLTFGSYVPKKEGKHPLLIWLHGGGEGGTDPAMALIANKAINYASEEIQSIFGGAFVLAPQTPTFWMQSEGGEYTRGDKNDIYNEALMALIEQFVADHPNVDKKRIYIGGCSNGGYMSLKLLLEHPDYFGAAYISALAYQNQYVSDEQIQKIKGIPIWFVHSKDDGTTVPDETVVPLYKRLVDAGAENVHFSYYDHVTDITGFFGGDDYRYNGHWSWIYSHANHADFDFDGKPVVLNEKPVSIMEWIAAQRK